MDNLKPFIDKIEDDKPINLIRFYNLVDKLNLSRPRKAEDVEARLVKGNLYNVTYIDKALLCQLESIANVDCESRICASLQNNSHATKVSGSFIVIRSGFELPEVVMIDDTGQFKDAKTELSQALIIENRQNFIDVEQTVTFLETQTAFKMNTGTTVIFSEGNQITNTLHKEYLFQFKRLYLCMDFDLGGLRIADTLMSLLPDKEITFLVPGDIASRLDSIVQIKPAEYIDDVIKIGLKNPLLMSFAKLIKEKRKVLEQEGYLHG